LSHRFQRGAEKGANSEKVRLRSSGCTGNCGPWTLCPPQKARERIENVGGEPRGEERSEILRGKDSEGLFFPVMGFGQGATRSAGEGGFRKSIIWKLKREMGVPQRTVVTKPGQKDSYRLLTQKDSKSVGSKKEFRK